MAKIIVFDIETAPMEVATFSLYPEAIGHNMILKNEFIICACWKELGSKTINEAHITKAGDDRATCKKLRDALAEADILIGQNIKHFDIKRLNARLIYHRLEPLPPIPVVDTLKDIKKVSHFASHRLDFLGKLLLGQGKIDTSRDLWLKAMRGDKKAIEEMVKYCKVDVQRTEDLYNVLKPYFASHPAMGVLMGHERGISCNVCGSTHIKFNGTRVSASGVKRKECQCQKCGHYQSITIKQYERSTTSTRPSRVRVGKQSPIKTLPKTGRTKKRIVFS